jgi:glycine cleavage system H protein
MEMLTARVDKFILRVPADRHYTADGVWALEDGGRVRVGVTDFLQQRSGDVAFAEAGAVGRTIEAGDEVAVIETIKADVEVASPVGGTIVEVNPALATAPDVINGDPYGGGWLAVIEARDWPADRDALLDPQAYFELMVGQAEEEARTP